MKAEDGGEYECIAENRAGKTSHSARLNIYGLPYVRPMSPISAVAGKDLVVKCPVAGYPIETVIWEKGKWGIFDRSRILAENGKFENFFFRWDEASNYVKAES